jgi:dihydroorotate dehydrogenase electron transfer subunit
MLQRRAQILSNTRLTAECRQLVLKGASEICEQVKPGQFVNLRITDAMDPLFRRPFSVVRTLPLHDGGVGLMIVYKVSGRGTTKLAALPAGEEIDVLGPCGTGFEVRREAPGHVLLGGGIGAACIHLLAEQLAGKPGRGPAHILLGALTRESLVLVDEFERLGARTRIATDDGSRGYRGRVTELLADLIAAGEVPKGSAVYACGPEPMFRALRVVCRKYELPAQVSVERPMACGMGVCLSCVCQVRREEVEKRRRLRETHVQFAGDDPIGYALTCRDGPVFGLEEVVLND